MLRTAGAIVAIPSGSTPFYDSWYSSFQEKSWTWLLTNWSTNMWLYIYCSISLSVEWGDHSDHLGHCIVSKWLGGWMDVWSSAIDSLASRHRVATHNLLIPSAILLNSLSISCTSFAFYFVSNMSIWWWLQFFTKRTTEKCKEGWRNLHFTERYNNKKVNKRAI